MTAGTYVWQVAANSGGSNIGTTDIGSFNVLSSSIVNESITYPMAAKVGKGKFYVSHGIFHFAYNNKTNDKTLSYQILSMNKNQPLKGLPKITLEPGVNKLKIDLNHNPELKNNNYYYLEITDKTGGIYKITYYYIQA